jgi:CysZ protein
MVWHPLANMQNSDSTVGLARAFLLALGQLGDPRLRAPLLKSLGLTLAAFAGLWIGLGFLLARTKLFEQGWLDGTVDALGGLAALILSIVLFPAVVAAFLGVFLDEVAAAVEARHYPDLETPRVRPLWADVSAALQLVATALALNLLVLPLYLVPGLNLLVFLATNGFLLAREYVTMSAARRLDSPATRALWRERRSQAWLAGIAFAALSTVPVVNLAAPVVAVATTTHLVEGWRRAARNR